MVQRTIYTTCTPLPSSVSRTTALAALHDHVSMIDLNPLVIERVLCKPPGKCSPEEYSRIWYAITDRVSYLPGGLASGKVTYHACFHDLPDGLQTHCYAPLGVDIGERWSIGGSAAGEAHNPPPMGIGAPKEGLYLREDIELRCNFLTTSFVKKNLREAHATLIKRLVYLTDEFEARLRNHQNAVSTHGSSSQSPSQKAWPSSPISHHAKVSNPASPLSQQSATARYEVREAGRDYFRQHDQQDWGYDHGMVDDKAMPRAASDGAPWGPHDLGTTDENNVLGPYELDSQPVEERIAELE